MESCVTDITIEFLAVAFHNILFHASIYPASVFETRRMYGIVVHHSIHPEINQYIDLCLKCFKECLKTDQLSRIEFAITNATYEPLKKFVFDIVKNQDFVETTDSYLIQAEQNLRAFCLKLSTMRDKFNNLPDDCSFTIFIHTNESTTVAMTCNPELESFPLVEVQEKLEEGNKIIPLRRFSIKHYSLDTYVEFIGE